MPSDRPDWWRRNERLREEMELPPYDPPRVVDGTYLHELVAELEAEYGCEVDLVSDDPTYPSTWSIHVDGRGCARVRRRREPGGNDVCAIEADEFRRRAATAVGGDGG